MSAITKKSTQLRVGDRVANDAMILVIDQEPRQTRHPVTDIGITIATDAIVENFDALIVEAAAGNDHAAWIVAMIRGDWAHKERNGIAHDGKPRWTIQGNDYATWTVISHDQVSL